MPHSDQQIGKVYYLSARKVHLFGIQDEAVHEQLNYVLDENELLGKGLNSMLSLVFNEIKQLNRGEKHLTMLVNKTKTMPPFGFTCIWQLLIIMKLLNSTLWFRAIPNSNVMVALV